MAEVQLIDAKAWIELKNFEETYAVVAVDRIAALRKDFKTGKTMIILHSGKIVYVHHTVEIVMKKMDEAVKRYAEELEEFHMKLQESDDD